MLEIARILAGGSVVLLIVSFTAWAASLGRPLFARLDGAASATANYHHTAALLLLTAVVTSSVAAFLAFADLAT
jgi:hypothetical protein